jgi:tol-pal system protein YbgF
LFNDDQARQQAQQADARVSALEDTTKQQSDKQSRTLLDLQSQIESLNAQLHTLQGQNEELTHSLQDAEKRQKDFYIDLDTRLRHFEDQEAAASKATEMNSAYGLAHGLFTAGKFQDAATAFQDFLKKYPDSTYAPNAAYEQGNAYVSLKDYQNALTAYRLVPASSPKAPDALLGIATCQKSLKAVDSANNTLKQLVSQYPDSNAAKEAKKYLGTKKK